MNRIDSLFSSYNLISLKSTAYRNVRLFSASSSVVHNSSSRRRRALPPPVNLTQEAADRIKVLLSQKPNSIGVRLGVRTRGCNGLSYTLGYVDEKGKLDEEVQDKGVRVFIEPKALFHIVGTTMDYKDTPVASEFVFENPNAKGSCGCGESFNV